VPYPTFTFAAAYVCGKGTCSAPIKDALALQKRIAGMIQSRP
jgi:hypothetical protein